MANGDGGLTYRPCVGIFLLNQEKKVWLGKRDKKFLTDPHLYEDKHLWQLPQGGIDEGETPEQAFQRELYEEVGVRNFKIIAEHPDWLTYDLPEHLIGKALAAPFRGQKQKWFAAEFLDSDEAVRLDQHDKPEFTTWCWASIDEVLDRVVPFKRAIYERICADFSHLVD